LHLERATIRVTLCTIETMHSPTRRLFGAAAAAVDLAVRRTALSRTNGKRNADALRHEVRMALLHRLRERYRRLGAYESFFREPRQITPIEDVRLSRPGKIRVVDLHWQSEYRTFLPEVQEQYDQYVENRTATARLVLHDRPRPIAVLIHGYLGGAHQMERRLWPMTFWRRLGMDLALFVLPFHGSRAAPGFGKLPPFPGAEPRITNEGFRQSMADFRDFVAFLAARGHPKIGVMGMSLGGYSTALAATLEPSLAFAVPIIPLASIPDAALLNGHLGPPGEESKTQHKALEAVHAMTSPLHRKLAIPASSVLVIGAEHDRITPIENARKLATHFHSKLETMHGGHLLQLGRNERFRSIGRFLTELGVVEPTAGGVRWSWL
jgi:pimeloyl-ACP methyl ester carboxylesterase